MGFNRDALPDAQSYFENEGLVLIGRGRWRTTACHFHGGSDSMRINLQSGAWVCMSCAAKGGDVLAHHMAAHGLEFIDAAKALGAWANDGRQTTHQRPAPLPPRAALQVLGFEAELVAVAAGNLAYGHSLTAGDLGRLQQAAGRINALAGSYA